MIYEHFRAAGAYEAVQGLSDLFNIRSHDGDVQDFDRRWDQALLTANEMPTEMILEGLCKLKLQDSVQRQTVLALYEQENIRNNGLPCFSRLKTAVRRHIDQVMRTKIFRVRNEILDRGTVIKSDKGKQMRGRRKEQSSSPALKPQAQTDGKIPSKGSSSGESPSWTRGRIP